MSLMDKIKSYKEEKKRTKLDDLEEIRSEIEEMISLGIPIQKQIELILENTNIDKLQYAEYYNILKKNFGYTGKKKGKKVFEYKMDNKPQKKSKNQPEKKKESVVDILSSDVDLMSMHLEKEAANQK